MTGSLLAAETGTPGEGRPRAGRAETASAGRGPAETAPAEHDPADALAEAITDVTAETGSLVEALDDLDRRPCGCRSPVIRIRSRHSRRALEIHRSAIAFARGARTGVLMIRTAPEVNTASNAAVNLVSRSLIKNLRPWA